MGTADGSGGFDIGVTTTGFTVGDYTVTAVCGAKLLAAPVSLVYVTSNTTAPTAQALVVAAALAFFLLLLGLVIRRPEPVAGPGGTDLSAGRARVC